MTKKITFIALIVIILVSGAVVLWRMAPSEKAEPTVVPGDNVVAPAKDHKNISYNIDGADVLLKNGSAEIMTDPGSASKTITKYFGNEAVGDIDGDGTEDIAFLLTQDGGGTGTFYYVVVALKTGTGYTGTNGILLGDRVAPQTTEIRNGYILINYAERVPGEPMTARPSVGTSKYIELKNGALAETPIFIDLPQKDATISSPLTVSGVAKGQWYFEATFPLVLLDENGNVVTAKYAQAQGEWMTTNYVPFSGTLEFDAPLSGSKGTLVLKKDNPSGLAENEDSRSILVVFK